jgi:hypothetical protein
MAKQKKDKPFILSKNIKNKLPASERDNAEKVLVEKSGGFCALCNRPLGKIGDLITADHRIAGGKSTLSNLYLAHKSCNSSRGNLEFNLVRPLVEFKVFSEEKRTVTFDDIIDNYISNGNRQITFSIEKNKITLGLPEKNSSQIFKDPATNTEYFFSEIPVEYIHNDIQVQPRLINYNHVRKLTLDFSERPVHEPSNCRLKVVNNNIAELLQFDGQHKTTAQILLGRTLITFKVYINPDIAMLQSLVVKIQQEIKKQPLTRSDTLAKMGDVFSSLFESYKPGRGKVKTEKGFVEFQPKEKRSEVKKKYFDELARIIFFDSENELTKWVKPGAKNSPTTDKVVINKIITSLIYKNLLEVNLEESGGRDNERKLIILILNTITRKMLPHDWFAENKIQKIRTENFFYQGSIGWWMNEILIPTLRYVLYRVGDKKPLLIDSISSEQENRIIEAVETLCDWEIWTTQDIEHIKAMRSNTVKNVIEVFPYYDDKKLIEEIIQ